MTKLNKLINYFFIIFFCLSFVSISAETTTEQYTWTDVIKYAQSNLPLKGVLKAKEDGFVYLKVDDDYIHTLFPMLELKQEGYKEPPYFRSKTAPGAHISVFYENEHVNPSEIGKIFHFTLANIVIVKPAKDTYYAVLQVNSPELEKLRIKYGCSPKLHGHEFHISIAKKVERHQHR